MNVQERMRTAFQQHIQADEELFKLLVKVAHDHLVLTFGKPVVQPYVDHLNDLANDLAHLFLKGMANDLARLFLKGI